jgi:hypothetical protein
VAAGFFSEDPLRQRLSDVSSFSLVSNNISLSKHRYCKPNLAKGADYYDKKKRCTGNYSGVRIVSDLDLDLRSR